MMEIQDNSANGNETLSLIVKSSARKEIIEISDSSTIYNFKEIVAKKFEVDIHSFRLIYAGRILKEADIIKKLNIKNGYTVYMVIKPSTQTASTILNDPLAASLDQQNTLNRTLLQHYATSPDILQSMLNNNPALQQVLQRNPEIGHIINNPSLLREAMEMIRSPNVANEFVRNADRAMSNIESLPGGFNVLQQMYHDIEEPLINATNDSGNPLASLLTSAISSSQQGTENRNPLPNPWSPNELTDNEMRNVLTNNPLLQSMTEQFQNYGSASGNLPLQLQDFPSLLTNITSSNDVNLQQANDALTQILSQNADDHTENTNLSPDIINAVILPALLLAGVTRNQPPDLSNNNLTNSNNLSPLLSQLNIQNPSNNAMNLGENYATQVQQLVDMGFLNEEANLQALVTSFGDLNRAIEILLSRNFPN